MQHTIHVEHKTDSTVLTVDEFGLAARLELVLTDYNYEAYRRQEGNTWLIDVTPKLYRNKLRTIIAEQFNPETVEVDTYD